MQDDRRPRTAATSPASIVRDATGTRSWRLGRYLGTVVYVDSSWPLILVLLAWTLAAGYFSQDHPEYPVWQRWLAGSLTAVLFFLAVLLRELVRALLTRELGEKTDRITLHFFGRTFQTGDAPLTGGAELVAVLSGPALSLAMSGLLVLGWHFLLPQASLTAGIVYHLAGALAYVAAFSLLPGLPLDGGRLLRLAWWRRTGDLRAAGRAAAWAGQTLAFLLVVLGALRLFRGDWLTGLWVTSSGWLLRNAAVSSFRQIVVREVMGDISAGQIMSRDFVSVDPHLSIRRLMEDYVVRRHQHAYPVLEDDHLLGIVCLHDISRVESERWDTTQVKEIMTPASDLLVVAPEDDGNLILDRLALRDLNQLPVVENGRLEGLVGRNDVVRYLQWQTELGMYT